MGRINTVVNAVIHHSLPLYSNRFTVQLTLLTPYSSCLFHSDQRAEEQRRKWNRCRSSTVQHRCKQQCHTHCLTVPCTGFQHVSAVPSLATACATLVTPSVRSPTLHTYTDTLPFRCTAVAVTAVSVASHCVTCTPSAPFSSSKCRSVRRSVGANLFRVQYTFACGLLLTVR